MKYYKIDTEKTWVTTWFSLPFIVCEQRVPFGELILLHPVKWRIGKTEKELHINDPIGVLAHVPRYAWEDITEEEAKKFIEDHIVDFL